MSPIQAHIFLEIEVKFYIFSLNPEKYKYKIKKCTR